MTVAIIGWGSLIWCPGTLEIKSRSRADGPQLPVEFARISDDGRMTLVIYESSAAVRTYWALSTYEEVDGAIENLQKRERAPTKELIHCLLSSGQVYEGDGTRRKVPDEVRENIRTWLALKPEISAVVWTALSTNWQDKRAKAFTVEDALLYARELEAAVDLGTTDERRKAQHVLDRACDYVRNTPAQVQTAVRKRLGVYQKSRLHQNASSSLSYLSWAA